MTQHPPSGSPPPEIAETRAGSSPARALTPHVPLRRMADGTFEFRCMACALQQRASWWPLDEEFWNFRRSLARCRACWAEADRARMRLKRQDPAFREKERRYSADYYASLSPIEIAAKWDKHRTYHRDWMRGYRERKRAA